MENNYMLQMQQEMVEVYKKEKAAGLDVYEIYAKYKNMIIEESYDGQDPDLVSRYQFVCDLAKHIITNQAMKEHGYECTGERKFWTKKEQQ